MQGRMGLTAVILTALTVGWAQAAAPEVGATQDNAYGIEGFALTRIAQPVYGWWPGDLEYYEFACKKGDVSIEGILVKPPLEDGEKLPGVVMNHGAGGNAKESGMEYGWELAVRGFVGIACNYTHSSVDRARNAAQTGAAEPARGERGAAPEAGARRGGEGGAARRGASRPSSQNDENYKRADAAIDILQHLPFVEADRIYMYGHSMGGFLTIAMAARSDKLKAAALTAAGMRGEPTEEENLARDAKCPVLVMHGTDDSTVDVTSGVRYYDELRKNQKDAKLIVFEGQPHRVHAYRAADVFDAAAEWYNAHP